METLLLLLPISISICNCIFTSCLGKILFNRVQKLEHSLTTHTHQYNPVLPSYTQATSPSAPPGYGYQFFPGDPNNQGLNVV